MVSLPAAAVNRAAQVCWPVPDEAVDDGVGTGGFDTDGDTMVADRGGEPVVLLGELLHAIGDRWIGDHGNVFLAAGARRGAVRAVGQCVAEKPPQDHTGHYHDDRDQCGDHTDADTTSSTFVAVTAPPVSESPVTTGRRRWRASGWLGVAAHKVGEVIRRVNVGGVRRLLELLVTRGRIGVVEIP
jgi:hypothetical protein